MRQTQLQWGHGITAVESGNKEVQLAKYKAVLQWGHGITAVESPEEVARLQGGYKLQWGHGITAVESWDDVRIDRVLP